MLKGCPFKGFYFFGKLGIEFISSVGVAGVGGGDICTSAQQTGPQTVYHTQALSCLGGQQGGPLDV